MDSPVDTQYITYMTSSDAMAIRSELFGSLFVLLQHLSRRADRELADLGLTTRQWLLLAVLTTRFPGRSASLSEAAQAYGSSRQNVRQVAGGLERAGYVRLMTDPADARVTRIMPTQRVAVFDSPAMVERTRVMLAEAFAGLTDDETAALRDLVRACLGGLRVESDDPAAHPTREVER